MPPLGLHLPGPPAHRPVGGKLHPLRRGEQLRPGVHLGFQTRRGQRSLRLHPPHPGGGDKRPGNENGNGGAGPRRHVGGRLRLRLHPGKPLYGGKPALRIRHGERLLPPAPDSRRGLGMGEAHPAESGHLFRRPEVGAQLHRRLGLVLCLRTAAPGGIPPSDLGKPGPGIRGGLCFRRRELHPGGRRAGGPRSPHPLSMPAVAGGKPVQPGAERQRPPLDADPHPKEGGLGGGTGLLPVPRDRGG